MGSVLENGLYLPDEGERNAYNGLKGNWNTLDNLVETVTALSSTGLIRKPVDALPITDIQTNVIYMLKATKPNGDVYRIEYMYIDDHWDALGTSETTLDDYYTKAETDDLPAVKSGVNATKVSNYDTHIADTDIHVTLANKQTWDGKQNALDTAQTAAVNSGVTGTKVTGYDTHVSDTDIHVTAADKTAWNDKQDGLSQTQLAAVNSGITGTKVTGYDSHIADTDVHVTTVDKAVWNGKQDALTQTQLNNIATIPDKANSADLATVATSGSYTDLINAPTIPTVNNATLTIQKNGTDVATFTANASSNVTANLSIPVNTSDLNNDAGFLTQHNPIDNELSATSENALQNKVVKSELDGKAPLVHTHAASDVTSGTFNIARIPNLDASKITSGTIDIARLPKGSLERLVKVADQTARYALTADDVQLGDTVQQLDTGVMYVVTDETKLDSADGYTEFTAGSASSVPWTGVTGKPSDYPPSSHTHTKSQITDFPAYGTTAGTICEGNDSRLSDARTPVAHTHTKSDVTDLLNSNFIPSANNSYDLGSSSYQWNNIYAKNYFYNGTQWGLDQVNTWTNDNTFKGNIYLNQGDANYIIPRGTNTVKGDLTTSGNFALMFKDKNNGNLATSGIGYLTLGQNSSGAYATIGVEAIGSTDNARHTNSISLKIDPTTNDNTAQFYPVNNNATDLGISTNQWKSVYAKNYYYNGTQWGLDQANEWTAFQRMISNPAVWYLRNNTVTLGTAPSSNRYIGMFFEDMNGADLGYAVFQANKNGYNSILFTLKNSDGTNTYLGGLRYRASTAGDYSFFPETGDCDLGTSTNKWANIYGTAIYENGSSLSSTYGKLGSANTWTQENKYNSTVRHFNAGSVYVNNTFSGTDTPSETKSQGIFVITNGTKWYGDMGYIWDAGGDCGFRWNVGSFKSASQQGVWGIDYTVNREFNHVVFKPQYSNGAVLGDNDHRWGYCHASTFYEAGTALSSKYAALASNNRFTACQTISGSNVGGENTTNYRTVMALQSNRDTDGKSCMYITKFRQNKAQGSMGANDLAQIAIDVLENEVRTNNLFCFGARGFSSNAPSIAIFSSGATGSSNIGTSETPWTNIYGTDLYSTHGTFTDTISVTNFTYAKNDTLVKGTQPTKTLYTGMYMCDKNGTAYKNNALGIVENSVDANNLVSTYMRAIKNEVNSQVACEIAVRVDASGTPYTYAPSPAVADNTTKIATTTWVTGNRPILAWASRSAIVASGGEYKRASGNSLFCGYFSDGAFNFTNTTPPGVVTKGTYELYGSVSPATSSTGSNKIFGMWIRVA